VASRKFASLPAAILPLDPDLKRTLLIFHPERYKTYWAGVLGTTTNDTRLARHYSGSIT